MSVQFLHNDASELHNNKNMIQPQFLPAELEPTASWWRHTSFHRGIQAAWLTGSTAI